MMMIWGMIRLSFSCSSIPRGRGSLHPCLVLELESTCCRFHLALPSALAQWSRLRSRLNKVRRRAHWDLTKLLLRDKLICLINSIPCVDACKKKRLEDSYFHRGRDTQIQQLCCKSTHASAPAGAHVYLWYNRSRIARQHARLHLGHGSRVGVCAPLWAVGTQRILRMSAHRPTLWWCCSPYLSIWSKV